MTLVIDCFLRHDIKSISIKEKMDSSDFIKVKNFAFGGHSEEDKTTSRQRGENTVNRTSDEGLQPAYKNNSQMHTGAEMDS